MDMQPDFVVNPQWTGEADNIYNKFKEIDAKLCLVSPELQGHDIKYIKTFKKILNSNSFKIDAICTKNPELWNK